MGGGFGGKEDVSAQHIAALAAIKVQRPVKVVFSRQESINFHPKRHAMEGTFTLGCDENGIFTGMDCEIYFDTGAYASLCGPVLERACTCLLYTSEEFKAKDGDLDIGKNVVVIGGGNTAMDLSLIHISFT